MIDHVVLFRWKPGTTDAQIEAVMEGLRGLNGQIPGLVEMQAGPDFSGRSQGYTHGLVSRFTDRAALAAYSPHPAHRRVVEELIAPIREDTLAFDLESHA